MLDQTQSKGVGSMAPVKATYTPTQFHSTPIAQENHKPTILEAYERFAREYCGARLYSYKTIEGYWWAIKSFIDLIGDIQTADLDHRKYSDWVVAMHERGNTRLTIHTNVARFRNFVDFMHLKGWTPLTKDDIKLPKKPKNRRIVYARVDEINLLIKHASCIRDAAIFAVMFSGALRASELRNLRKSNIDLVERKINIEHGKGDKDATLFLTDTAKDLIERYWASRTDNMPWAFVAGKQNNGSSGKIAPSTLRYIFDSTCKRAGLSRKLSPKAIRHGHGTYLMKKKVPMREIQEAMRHEWITTTQLYTHVEAQDLESDVLPVLQGALTDARSFDNMNLV
mgnify:CR=1 FL=1